MDSKCKVWISDMRQEFKKEIKEADRNPNKWYELFVVDVQGVRTLYRESTFKAISAWIPKLHETYKLGDLHIDIWEDDTILPLPVCELDVKGDISAIEGLDYFGGKVYEWLEGCESDREPKEKIIRQCLKAIKIFNEDIWTDDILLEEVWAKCEVENVIYKTALQWLIDYFRGKKEMLDYDIVAMVFASLRKDGLDFDLHEACVSEVVNSTSKLNFMVDILGWDKRWTPSDEEAQEHFKEFYMKLIG